MSAPRLNDQLCFALYSASSRITAIYRPILDELELTYPQFVAMMALWESDNISITQLALRCSLSKATMTPLLKKLESKSFVILNRDPNNDRQKIVVLTPKGKKLASTSTDATTKAFCATGLTLKDAKLMIGLCNRIGA